MKTTDVKLKGEEQEGNTLARCCIVLHFLKHCCPVF